MPRYLRFRSFGLHPQGSTCSRSRSGWWLRRFAAVEADGNDFDARALADVPPRVYHDGVIGKLEVGSGELLVVRGDEIHSRTSERTSALVDVRVVHLDLIA